MKIAADFKPLGWVIDHLNETILVVHQVIEREMRIDPRRRQNLEKRLVAIVVRVRVAAAVEVAAAEPWRRGNVKKLVAAFERA